MYHIIIKAGWCSIMGPCCVCVCVWVDQVVTDMRLWLRNAISTLTENALQLISTLVERAAAWDRHTLMQANTHIYPSLSLFLKLPFGVFCHLLLSQRNWCPVSWLHPHAESSANQVEPLDSKVTEDSTANLTLFIHEMMCSSCESPASLPPAPSVMLLPWAETWTSFRRSRKELMFYPSAGKTRRLAMILTHRHNRLINYVLVFSGAIAGTPFDIDRELLRKGQTENAQNHCPVKHVWGLCVSVNASSVKTKAVSFLLMWICRVGF